MLATRTYDLVMVNEVRPMPKGPQGQKRPADVVRNIVQVMRIATGDAEEKPTSNRRKKATPQQVGDTADKITRAPKKKKKR